MTHFTLKEADDRITDLRGGGVLLARVRRDGSVYYLSQDAAFKQKVDAILVQLYAKQAIAREENHRRFNAESKADEDRRAVATERALFEGLGE